LGLLPEQLAERILVGGIEWLQNLAVKILKLLKILIV
jgi:hypothetical protein